jgi:hypothetical protein
MPAAPAVAPFTSRWFDQLPRLYRAADEADRSVDGWPLLRFLSLLGDQADELATLVDRFALHDDGTGTWVSDLGDPNLADVAWLDWLAQFGGLEFAPGTDPGGKRAAIAGVVFLNGTPDALKAAVAGVLAGTRRVTLIEQYNGDPLAIVIWVYAAEVVDADLLAAAIAAQKPAGLTLVGSLVQPGLTWYDAAHQYASWTAFAAGGAKTWAQRSTEVPTY